MRECAASKTLGVRRNGKGEHRTLRGYASRGAADHRGFAATGYGDGGRHRGQFGGTSSAFSSGVFFGNCLVASVQTWIWKKQMEGMVFFPCRWSEYYARVES